MVRSKKKLKPQAAPGARGGVEPLELRRLFAAALTLFDSGGFEAPRYSPGPLESQDPQGPWLKDTARVGVASVQTGTVRSGNQAVRLTRPAAANGDTRYGVVKRFTPSGDLDVVRVSWDMNIPRNEQTGVTYGPFLGVEAYDTVGVTPLLIGSLGVDASTGDVLYQDGTTSALTETGTIVALGQWNQFTLEVDYATDTYTVFVNGEARASTTFVADAAAGFSDAPIAALAASADTVATATGTAFIDNYRIEVSAEPTPPAVSQVFVSGSSWSPPFLGLLEAKRLGSEAYGYAVPDGARQLDVLPWDNLDQVSIVFNRDVLVARDDLSVRGAGGGEYAVADFRYDRAAKTATWVLARPLGGEMVRIDLDGDAGGVAAPDGVTRLDGEWANGADAYPSGDGASGGTPGNDFRFQINVLPGDVSRNRRVDAADLLQVRARQQSAGDTDDRSRGGYSIFHDVNGDGAVNVVDLVRVRRRIGSSLAAPVTATAAPAPVTSLWLDIQPDSSPVRRGRPARPA